MNRAFDPNLEHLTPPGMTCWPPSLLPSCHVLPSPFRYFMCPLPLAYLLKSYQLFNGELNFLFLSRVFLECPLEADPSVTSDNCRPRTSGSSLCLT